jgi:hypothetical protein
MECTKERIGIPEAQQEGRIIQFHGGLFQIVAS